MAGWIGVDLDGTLAHHAPGDSVDHVGDPIEPMVRRVKKWLDEGKHVKIFTARVADPNYSSRMLQIRMIEDFCQTQFGRKLEVTNVKDYAMRELWDDRAISVERNTGRVTTENHG